VSSSDAGTFCSKVPFESQHLNEVCSFGPPDVNHFFETRWFQLSHSSRYGFYKPLVIDQKHPVHTQPKRLKAGPK
jgi:hypothetical protein